MTKNKSEGDYLDHRAIIDEFLAPFKVYLDSDLTEICVNRPGEVWTENTDGWHRHEAPDVTFQHCRHFAQLIATYNKKAINTDAPILSATLPDGERVQVIIPPACAPDTISITIRKPSFVDMTLTQIAESGAFDSVKDITYELQEYERELLKLKEERRYMEFLQKAVETKRNILIVGKTGSGKTTVTKSLIRYIPHSERLVTIEDVHELFMDDFPNKVHLFYGREDEGGVKVTSKQALASCLRMKPDRILLAELRGDEAWEYVKSVNTGHPGSITTMHANGAYEAFEQLAAFIKDSRTGQHLETDYIRHRLFTTIDVVMFFDKFKMRELYYDPNLKRAKAAQDGRSHHEQTTS